MHYTKAAETIKSDVTIVSVKNICYDTEPGSRSTERYTHITF